MCLAHSNKTIPFLVGYGIQRIVLWHATKYSLFRIRYQTYNQRQSRERLIGKKYCSLLEISQQIIAAQSVHNQGSMVDTGSYWGEVGLNKQCDISFCLRVKGYGC